MKTEAGEAPKRRSKFNAVATVIDGIRFQSKAEATRWVELKAAHEAGEIFDLQRQVKFKLNVNGIPVCDYVCDFCYRDAHGYCTVEDVKFFPTPVYRLKKKLMKAVLGIEIFESGLRPRKQRKRASGAPQEG